MKNQNLTPAQAAFATINTACNAAGIETYSDDHFYYGNDGWEFPYVFIISAEHNPATGLIDCQADEFEPDGGDPVKSFELANCTPDQAAAFIIARFESADAELNARY